jgi:hypothetical protein
LQRCEKVPALHGYKLIFTGSLEKSYATLSVFLVVWAATSTPKKFQKIIIIIFLVKRIHIYMGSFESLNVDL